LLQQDPLKEQTLNSTSTRTETTTHLLSQFHQKDWAEAFIGSEAGGLLLRLSELFERDSVDVGPIFSRIFQPQIAPQDFLDRGWVSTELSAHHSCCGEREVVEKLA
jgi:hypothetical protein